MPYRILADTVIVVHFAFIMFVAVGALLTWRWPRLVRAHLPALAWGVGSLTVGVPCPLTALEKTLRRLAGDQPYDNGFVDEYLENVIYPDDYSTALRAVAALLVLGGYWGLRRRGRAVRPAVTAVDPAPA